MEDGGALAKGGEIEWRKYMALTRRSEFAVRLFFGYSDGNRPNLFSFGGMDIIRGFPTYSITGNRGGFVNLEWRFPLIDRMDMSFMSLSNIRARFFMDVGAAWYEYGGQEFNYLGQPGFVFIGEKEVNGEIVGESGRLQDGVSTYGFGISMNLMGIPIHWDWVQRWDFKDSLGGMETHFWIGYRF
jgi:hypothetical protein